MWTVGAVAAVVVGVVFGVVSSLPDRSDRVAAPPSSSSLPTLSLSVAGTTTASVPEGGDPEFTPTLKRLEDDGDRIELFWTDPSDGNAQFVVVDVTGRRRSRW